MKYDDAEWHSGGEFPEDSPSEYRATHIALFLKWCFLKGWIGELHKDERESEDLELLLNDKLSATAFFIKYCDGKLTDEDFDEIGNDFASQYYGDDGLYFDDYVKHFGHLIYVAPESDHDFIKYSAVLEHRYQTGILTKTQRKAEKPWWKFW